MKINKMLVLGLMILGAPMFTACNILDLKGIASIANSDSGSSSLSCSQSGGNPCNGSGSGAKSVSKKAAVKGKSIAVAKK